MSFEDGPYVTYKPGDRVVYPHHGAAVIEKKEKRKAFGEETEYLVLRMAHGDMTLAVPVDKIIEQLDHQLKHICVRSIVD